MMLASLMIDLVAMAAAGAMPQAGDCRTIADPAARLACYDSREAPAREAAPATSGSTPPAYTPPAPAYAPLASAAAPTYTPPPASPAEKVTSRAIIRADPTGRVVSVTPLRYGLSRITLDDGRAFDTATNTAAPPPVGASVRLRRTPLGTTFLDVPGEAPLTVRLVRR